jgi:hypothetical protein
MSPLVPPGHQDFTPQHQAAREAAGLTPWGAKPPGELPDQFDWITLPLSNGWRDYNVANPGEAGLFYAPCYAVLGPLVILRGVADGAQKTSTTVVTLPPALRPARLWRAILDTDAGMKQYNVWDDGRIAPVAGGGNSYVVLDLVYATA